jgi:hypothetical protein
MHTPLSILFILGLIGVELWLAMGVLAVLTSRHPPARRDYARRNCDADERL